MTGSTERLWQRAQNYLADGQTAPARVTLESLLARDPTNIHAHLILSGIAWREDRMRDAVRHALDAARVVSDEGADLITVASALLHLGEFVMARQLLARPAIAQAKNGDLLVHAAAMQQRIGDHPASLEFYQRARAAGMDGLDFRFDRATQLAFNGQLDEAEAELEFCTRMETHIGRVYVELARMRRQTPERNHLQVIDRQRAMAMPGSMDLGAMEFARYKELEDLGHFEEAWNALSRGNELIAARTRYDPAREERLLDRMRDICNADYLDAGNSAHEGPVPIFVIGMTRSGTTLLDRILGNHSMVESAGELEDFARQLRHVAGSCTLESLDERVLDRLPNLDLLEVGRRYLAQTQWRANGRAFFVDKLPLNWPFAGLIRRCLPQARILHLSRDPMDVCFSNFRAFFGEAHGWSYRIETLVHYFRQYRKTMQHWQTVMPGRILDVSYAELVRDPEAMARRVFAFCGLEYEDGCADLSRNTTAVATLSLAQVRGGIHTRAFEEWRPYEAQLAGLLGALAVDGRRRERCRPGAPVATFDQG